VQRSKWILIAGTLVLALFSLATADQNGQAQADSPTWGLVDSIVPNNASLNSVFMLDQNNAWVAGADGNSGKAYRLQFSAGSWHLLQSETATFSTPAHSLVAISDSNIWLVGDAGLIAHKDGSGWHILTSPAPEANLYTIQMFGNGDEGWAGGVLDTPPTGRPIILHFKSGKWDEDSTISARSDLYRPVNSLHFAPNGGYAVGINQIWHYEGTRWVEEAVPVPPLCVYTLTGVRTITDRDAWATGGGQCSGPPNPGAVLLHRVNGNWQSGLSGQSIMGDPWNGSRWGNLSAISFTDNGFGLAVGGQAPYGKFLPSIPFIISYRADGKWHYENTPVLQSTLTSVSQADAGHALAVGSNGVILSYGYGPGSPVPTPTATTTPMPYVTPPPSDKIPDPRNASLTYFPEAGHTLAGGFRDYWTAHGGLEQFGYPITEEFQEISPTDGLTYTVQYFERARFEWHPENRPPYDVLLGLLGRTITQGRENEQPFQVAPAKASPGNIYFQETGHNLAAEFTQYWQQHGGLPVYGYPISEAFTEVSPTDGKPYLVQYFERNRLEYHPELPAPYRVSLGLLGVQVLTQRGWLK
jgi:hypothetical protein